MPEIQPIPASAADAFLQAAVGPNSEHIDHADIRRLLGEPQRIDVVTHPNQHASEEINTLTTFVYSGITATALSASAVSNRFLTRVEITHSGIATPHGIRVGQLMKDVVTGREEPVSHHENGSLLYTLPGEAAPHLVIIPDASGERVAEVHYAMYTG